MLLLSCFCYAFVRVCLLMSCVLVGRVTICFRSNSLSRPENSSFWLVYLQSGEIKGTQ